MTGRRIRATIYAQILDAIDTAERAGQDVKVTPIQTMLNVPFVRFQEYIDDLVAKGLVKQNPHLGLTGEGRAFLEEYQRIAIFLRRFGLLAEPSNAKLSRAQQHDEVE